MNKAVFLDRDGVINVDTGYLYKFDDLELTHRLTEALKILKKLGYMLIVVTNQSGVARGFYTEKQVDDFHDSLSKLLSTPEQAFLDAIYYCPHHPKSDGECNCRKPQPGMLLNAKTELGINMEASYMVGDKSTDMQAGKRAGITNLIGISENSDISGAVKTFLNLYEFAKELLENEKVLGK